MSGVNPGAMVGLAYASSLVMDAMSAEGRKIYFVEDTLYSGYEHVEHMLKMWTGLKGKLPDLLAYTRVDPKRFLEVFAYFEAVHYYPDHYAIPKNLDDEAYFRIAVDLLLEMGRWFYDFGRYFDREDDLEDWIRLNYLSPQDRENFRWAAHTAPYQETNATYAGYFEHHRAWLLARAITMKMGEAWEKEIEKAKILPELFDIFRKMNLAYYRRQLEASPVPKEEWEPLLERLEKLYKEEPFPFHRGSELRRMLSVAIEKKYYNYLKDAIWE